MQKSDIDALASRIAALESAVKALSDDARASGARRRRPGGAVDRRRRGAARRGRTRRAVSGRACRGAIARRRRKTPPRRSNRSPPPACRARLRWRTNSHAHAGACGAPPTRRPADRTFLGRLEANAQHLVRITPVDAPAGNDPSAIIARIDADAARADIAAALTDIAALPESAKPLAADWVKKANARDAAIAASRQIAADALAALEQAGRAMIRVVLFLIVVGALSLGVAWLADRPGDVVITWQGLRIETSLMVFAAAVLVAMAVLALIWSLVRAIVRSPFCCRGTCAIAAACAPMRRSRTGSSRSAPATSPPRKSTPPRSTGSRPPSRWRFC